MLVLGDLISRLVLDLQAGVTSESLAWALDATDSRAVVHQATGMIAAQLNVGVAEALVQPPSERLRNRSPYRSGGNRSSGWSAAIRGAVESDRSGP